MLLANISSDLLCVCRHWKSGATLVESNITTESIPLCSQTQPKLFESKASILSWYIYIYNNVTVSITTLLEKQGQKWFLRRKP